MEEGRERWRGLEIMLCEVDVRLKWERYIQDPWGPVLHCTGRSLVTSVFTEVVFNRRHYFSAQLMVSLFHRDHSQKEKREKGNCQNPLAHNK